jgi:hypothetical protein
MRGLTVSMLEEVHYGKNLSVVGDEALREDIRGLDELLQVPQGLHHDLRGFGTQCLLDRDDQLRQDREDLVFTLGDERGKALVCQEPEGVLCFTQAVEEDGEVVMVVQEAHIHFPGNLEVLG